MSALSSSTGPMAATRKRPGASQADGVTRLDTLRAMREFIDREIDAEIKMLDAPLATTSLVQRAADLYGVAVADITAGNRTPQVTKARQAAAWILREQELSLPQIGRILGLHHTTVLHACRKIDASPTIRALLTWDAT